MDGLDDNARIEAWKATWRVSFSGIAILTKDFKFHRVNDQWIKLLGVPATEFYGRTFLDITSPEIKKLDEEQAKLLIDGKINSYILHKEYIFSNGERKKVTLLVTRIPIEESKPFQFFLSRIMLRHNFAEEQSPVGSSSQTLDEFFKFIRENSKLIITVGLFVGGVIYEYYKRMFK